MKLNVYEFSEPTSGHSGTLSYFVKEIGFIIYCDKAHNISYELNSITGNIDFDSLVIEKLILSIKSDAEFKINKASISVTSIPLLWWQDFSIHQ